jgi:cytochrome P450
VSATKEVTPRDTVGINDDLFTLDVINDPYTYLGHLREEDPVHWNELYEVWVLTRHDDLVWLTRHHELFSSEVLKRDPRPPYPQVDASDLELYEYVKGFSSDQFIQHDRPEHLEMRKVIHGYFTPRSMEAWRPMVQSAITDLLDAAEAQGRHRGPALHQGVGQEAPGRGPGGP